MSRSPAWTAVRDTDGLNGVMGDLDVDIGEFFLVIRWLSDETEAGRAVTSLGGGAAAAALVVVVDSRKGPPAIVAVEAFEREVAPVRVRPIVVRRGFPPLRLPFAKD